MFRKLAPNGKLALNGKSSSEWQTGSPQQGIFSAHLICSSILVQATLNVTKLNPVLDTLGKPQVSFRISVVVKY